ncbi:MAG: replicative DNA helicase [Muribaculaceae bacterium]|jgi:replicative DNA helicase
MNTTNPEPHNPLDPECLPLHNTEMEKTALATLMTFGSSLEEIGDVLSEDCFYDIRNKEIFKAIKSVYSSGHFPDMTLVSSELAKMGSDVTILEVTELCVNTVKVADLHPHVLILKDYALRRKLWKICYHAMCRTSGASDAITAIHKDVKDGLDSLFDQEKSELSTLGTVFKKLNEKMIFNHDQPDGFIYGTPTGFPELDRDGGLCGTDLIIVGAETSQGKTSFATALAMSAIEYGDGVAFYSMEMTSLQLAARIASMRSGISSKRILRQKMTEEEIFKIGKAMQGIDMDKLFFDEKSTSSLDSIVMSIRMMKLRNDIKGAVVDYMQLIQKMPGMSTEQATARCARDLKNLAKELDIWIIAISQLSRDRSNPLPSMSRLRDSGQIEEAADNIYLIYRARDNKQTYPEPFTGYPTDGTAMVIIGKGRNTGTGEFLCGFKGENTLFYPLTEYDKATMERVGTEQKTALNNDVFPF